MRNALIFGSAVLVACAGGDSNKSATSSTVPVSEAKSALARNTSPTVADADQTTFAHDNEAFALAAYGALAKAPGNVFFSPYSISSALAMTYAGANGPTATEMATALHFTLPADKLHPAFDRADLALNHAPADGSFALHVTSSIWGQTGEKFGQPFLDTLAVSYGAGLYLQDFAAAPAAAEGRINQWVADETAGKIQKLLDGQVTSGTRLVLVDAIYFDADWQSPFDPALVEDGPFDTGSGSVDVSMMSADGNFYAVHTANYDAIQLPYRGGAVMDIVLPAAGTLASFESTLTAEALDAIIESEASQEVRLALPKFGYEGGSFSIKPLLQGFGMNLAFTDQADFSPITPDPIHITDVVQKAFLRVDEKGTEAAAATAVLLGDAGITVNPVEPLRITVDHPFFFTIRDSSTNTILFAGRMTDPTR